MGGIHSSSCKRIFECNRLVAFHNDWYRTGIVLASLFVIYILAIKILGFMQKVVFALRNISEGEGDLTAKLPIDIEIANLAIYLKQTIKKIALSIKNITKTVISMYKGGFLELNTNMEETSKSVNEISSNIKNVKQKTLNQVNNLKGSPLKDLYTRSEV